MSCLNPYLQSGPSIFRKCLTPSRFSRRDFIFQTTNPYVIRGQLTRWVKNCTKQVKASGRLQHSTQPWGHCAVMKPLDGSERTSVFPHPLLDKRPQGHSGNLIFLSYRGRILPEVLKTSNRRTCDLRNIATGAQG